jgi:hypothetical protein
MYKKRLEDALNAAKLIRLGFSLNFSKPDKIDLLYKVNCSNYDVFYANQELKNLSPRVKKQSKINPSDSDDDNADIRAENLANSSDLDEKIEVLCIKFNEAANLVAIGDSNGQIKVSEY